MANPFVAEIRVFPFNFAPRGWAFCNGQLFPISQNTALFSLLGTTYGGDGRSTFALPDLRGRVPMQPGQGPGLTLRELGETGGSDTVQLLESEMPNHRHAQRASTAEADLRVPSGSAARVLAAPLDPIYAPPEGTRVATSPLQFGPAGGNQPHNNLMPYLTLSYCIALQGVFPQRG